MYSLINFYIIVGPCVHPWRSRNSQKLTKHQNWILQLFEGDHQLAKRRKTSLWWRTSKSAASVVLCQIVSSSYSLPNKTALDWIVLIQGSMKGCIREEQMELFWWETGANGGDGGKRSREPDEERSENETTCSKKAAEREQEWRQKAEISLSGELTVIETAAKSADSRFHYIQPSVQSCGFQLLFTQKSHTRTEDRDCPLPPCCPPLIMAKNVRVGKRALYYPKSHTRKVAD